MRALLVTSRVTFVPDNYDGMVCGLAADPRVAGLVVIDNRRGVVLKALTLFLLGAPRTAWRMLVNRFGPSRARRRAAYERAGKWVWELEDVNSPALIERVRGEGIDLVINARTRSIYRDALLGAPRLGCVNVHHGLLPDERGTMCDLWALIENRDAGFSIHRMTSRVDAGGILRRVIVAPAGHGIRDFHEYMAYAMAVELTAIRDVLAEFARGDVTETPNVPTAARRYRRNPDWKAIRSMRRQGMRV